MFISQSTNNLRGSILVCCILFLGTDTKVSYSCHISGQMFVANSIRGFVHPLIRPSLVHMQVRNCKIVLLSRDVTLFNNFIQNLNIIIGKKIVLAFL